MRQPRPALQKDSLLMDIGSIFLILAFFILVALFVSQPFMNRRTAVESASDTAENHEVSALLAERDRILGAIQELDFDYTLGKIPEEDYPGQRAVLLQRGADVLRQLDEHQPDSAAEDVEARIEAVVAARRMDARRVPAGNGVRLQPANAVITEDDDLEALLANRRRERQEKSAGFCPKCGGPVQKSDRFCPKCGKDLV